jgi:hypothetical protein
MFEEAPGHTSATRVMSFVSLLAACGFGYLTLTAEDPSRIDAAITLIFVTGAFAPKVFQKAFEAPLPVQTVSPTAESDGTE